MSTFPLEPSLVEVAIGEVDEPPASPSNDGGHQVALEASPERRSKPVQRSMSDRYSYRAAIYNHNRDNDDSAV